MKFMHLQGCNFMKFKINNYIKFIFVVNNNSLNNMNVEAF